ncbi:NusG domain II-containing protein [candidate division WOR-3 bacterium]|nr:NusG domain II-containing protein [candidate division WOR-3 bacterium]
MKSILKFYPYQRDYFVVGIFFALAVILIINKFKTEEKSYYAVVETAQGENVSVPLSKDTSFSVEGRIGRSEIQIESGRARIASSPCPKQICVKRGWISRTWESATCLPNGVWLSIEGEKQDIDATTY